MSQFPNTQHYFSKFSKYCTLIMQMIQYFHDITYSAQVMNHYY